MINTQLDIRRLSSRQGDFAERFRQLGHTQVETGAEIERAVRDIIDDVRQRGDTALVEYTNRFDRRRVNAAGELELAPAQLQQALDGLDRVRRAAHGSAQLGGLLAVRQLGQQIVVGRGRVVLAEHVGETIKAGRHHRARRRQPCQKRAAVHVATLFR